ncbi:DUF934 domain-containing protein [Fodinicurvata sp. EGI_FJ10296]|uniref:DUF934 domain-containing protein n=1 Tax=Fodinicurvata sp. EGI_FJ10296 TaxID=3231908 RepID=UPI003455D243
MPLLKHGRPVADVWIAVADATAPPAGDHLLLTADQLADYGAVPVEARPDARWGVTWPNDRPVSDLAPHLDRLSLVCLSFPTFKDGRAYSQARQLREHYGFSGEIRATGQVLRDQFAFMVRAGFDALLVARDADADAFDREVASIPVVYQPGADNRMTAFRARVGGAGVAS